MQKCLRNSAWLLATLIWGLELAPKTHPLEQREVSF